MEEIFKVEQGTRIVKRSSRTFEDAEEFFRDTIKEVKFVSFMNKYDLVF